MTEPMSLKGKNAERSVKKSQEGGLGETIKVIVQALLIALVVRTFLFQPFNIPSGSLIPTLLIGDYLFVSKYSYGYSKFSFPFSPNLFSGRIFGTPPKRGDVAVFKLPLDGQTDYIKRVIGLPGDKIQLMNARLYINGQEVPREPTQKITTRDQFGNDVEVPTYKETLPGGVTHLIIQRDGDNGYYSNTGVFEVPADHYLHDGRQPGQFHRLARAAGAGRGGLRAVRELRRTRGDHLLLDQGGCAGLGILALADHRAMEPHFPTRAMTRSAARPDLSGLEDRIGYRFVSRHLADQALTHMSASSGQIGRNASYQRLEFLGDRVLGLAVSDMLFAAYPAAAEGELSRRLADLVRRETCAEVAGEWDLGPHIAVGGGETQSGSRGRPAILADVCEALIGAVFLDGGYGAARSVVAEAWTRRMLAPRRALRDPKTTLQEWVQALGRPPPVYSEVERSGPAHAPSFVVAVAVPGFESVQGHGSSKRIAEQAAADAFMLREGVLKAEAQRVNPR